MAAFTPTLTDLYGVEWNFAAPGSPIRMHDIEGLDAAAFELDDFAGVNQPGVTTLGRTDKPNVITITAFIDGEPGGDCRDILVRYRSGLGRTWALDPTGPLMRFGIAESGRFQEVRLFSAERPDYRSAFDVGRAKDVVKLRSDESWWRTDPLTRTFTAAQFASASIPNYGDEAAWPHYRLYGPIASPTLGMVGEVVPLPSVAIGGYLDIETDPDLWKVVDQTGADRSWIGDRWYVPAPARRDDTNPIPITVTGTNTNSSTRLEVTLPQLFWYPL